MHYLREKRATPGDIRQGVLVLALSAVAATLIACGPGGPARGGAPAGVGREARASWLQLQSTVFQTVAAPDASPPVPSLPWTVQSRVADMAFLGDVVYLAINGAGLAAIDPDASGALKFSYHYDTSIFPHRTITTLIPRHGDLMIHLYYNALLNDAKPGDLLLRGISLVTFLPGQRDFAFLIPPYQKKNPEWEAVGFAPISEDEFDFEWKYTDTSETRFVYTRYRADMQVEAGSNRDAYIAALGTPALEGPDVPPSYSAFFEDCRSRLTMPAGTALHFKVRFRRLPVQRYFRSGPDQDSILVIHVLDENGTLRALLPGGQVLEKPAGVGSSRTIALPELPAGFRYTDLLKKDDSLIVTWEEARFTEVGRAGILVLRRFD
ncbi:MAG TPA: hypothetical protein VMU36_13565 [Spirochaetia bacterium]|nr:hypothetical protein [Spirochaetia bacterium]